MICNKPCQSRSTSKTTALELSDSLRVIWKFSQTNVYLILHSFSTVTPKMCVNANKRQNSCVYKGREKTFNINLLLLLLLSCFSHVRLCATSQTAAHQAPLSLGFSREEHWSGLPFPSPVHESETWKWSLSRVRLFATRWTAAYQVPPSMGFPRQEYWSGVPSPSPTPTSSWSKATYSLSFLSPWWLSWYRIHLQCRRPGFDPWVGKMSWRREWLPTPVFWPEEFSPWGRKELDMPEGLSLPLVKKPRLDSSIVRFLN